MSSAAGTISPSRKAQIGIPPGMSIPLIGIAWVFINLILMAGGIWDAPHLFLFSMAAGGIDGGILGWVLITVFSEKLHAGSAGLLGGYGFQEMLNRFQLTGKYVGWFHRQIDPVLDTVLGPQHEGLHEVIQKELVWMGGTAAAVVLATLIIQIVRSAASSRG